MRFLSMAGIAAAAFFSSVAMAAESGEVYGPPAPARDAETDQMHYIRYRPSSDGRCGDGFHLEIYEDEKTCVKADTKFRIKHDI